METMTHRQRLDWLASRGFLSEVRSCTLPDLGTCVWIDGNKGMRTVSLWLSVREGKAILHGPGDQVMSWEDLQEWIEPTRQPEPVKAVAKARSLFGDDQ